MKKFDREAYLKTIQLVKEAKEHNEQHRRFNNINQEMPDSTGLNIKSILITSVIIAIALFVLVGTIILIPIVLVAILGYLVFLWCRTSIK
jgi:Flp pilus assembly protein TadB